MAAFQSSETLYHQPPPFCLGLLDQKVICFIFRFCVIFLCYFKYLMVWNCHVKISSLPPKHIGIFKLHETFYRRVVVTFQSPLIYETIFESVKLISIQSRKIHILLWKKWVDKGCVNEGRLDRLKAVEIIL